MTNNDTTTNDDAKTYQLPIPAEANPRLYRNTEAAYILEVEGPTGRLLWSAMFDGLMQAGLRKGVDVFESMVDRVGGDDDE